MGLGRTGLRAIYALVLNVEGGRKLAREGSWKRCDRCLKLGVMQRSLVDIRHDAAPMHLLYPTES